MAKECWITFYRSVSNPVALAEYAKPTVPAVEAGGSRIIVRGTAANSFETGLAQRVVVTVFENTQRAASPYESSACQAALRLLAGAAERDVRIVDDLP